MAKKENHERSSLLFFLLQRSRPLLWPVGALITGVGMLLASKNIQQSFSLQTSFILFLLLFTMSFPYALAGYGINDYYDENTDRKNPRKKERAMTQREKQWLKKVSYGSALWMLLVGFLVSLFFQKVILFFLMVFLLVLGGCYSLPPCRLKEKLFLDSLSNAFFYVLFPFLLGYLALAPTLSWILTKKIIGIMLYAMALHLYAAIVDYEADRQAGQKTTATRLGKQKSLFLVFFYALIGFLLVHLQTWFLWWYALLILFLLFFIALFQPSQKRLYFIGKAIYLSFLFMGVWYSIFLLR